MNNLAEYISQFIEESRNDIILGVFGFIVNVLLINYIIKYRNRKDFEKKWSAVRLLLYSDILYKITHFFQPFFTKEQFASNLITIEGNFSKRQVLRQLHPQDISMIISSQSLPSVIRESDLHNLNSLLDELQDLIGRHHFIVDSELIVKILGFKQMLNDLNPSEEEGFVSYYKSFQYLMFIQWHIYFDIKEFKKYNLFLNKKFKDQKS